MVTHPTLHYITLYTGGSKVLFRRDFYSPVKFTPLLETSKCVPVLFFVCLVCQNSLVVCCLAVDFLDVIAPAGFFQVGCESPLAYAPILDWKDY